MLPIRPINAQDIFDVNKYCAAAKDHCKKVQAYDNFDTMLYLLVFGQCSPVMQERIWLHADFAAVQNYIIGLLQLIKALMHLYKSGTEKLGQALCW